MTTALVSCALLSGAACGSDAAPGGGDAGGSSDAGGSGVPPQGGGGATGEAGADSGGAGADSGGQAGSFAEGGVTGEGAAAGAGGAATPDGVTFSQRVLVEGLASPWELTWGPDDWLWATERVGRRVIRIRPSDGLVEVALELDEVQVEGGQDGLLGMALHPRLLAGTDEDFVYVAYSYEADAGRRFKLRRYTYDASAGTLNAPEDLLTDLPASSDHNGGRLRVGPDERLYYAIGDQGANQFDRKCNPNRAQELPTAEQVQSGDYQAYQGKLVRVGLDGSIPDDNPAWNGVQSHVFSVGHRNPQGLAFGPSGALFSSEQGPKTDDELNRIEGGHNYGWPHVAGFRDDAAYAYANWSAAPDCEQLTFSDYELPESVPQEAESAWSDERFEPPLMTFYTVEPGHEFQDPQCEGNSNICWPTIAPSSLELYSAAEGVPAGWTDSLLVTSLKQGTVFRVPLSADGSSIAGEATALFKTTNRYRDVAVSPDGRTFYVITDAQGPTASIDGGATSELENRGSVLEFQATQPRL
jgi:PQQ-dependent dehydrogenase (s-GDH family)